MEHKEKQILGRKKLQTAVITGVAASFFWGWIAYAAYYFNLSDIGPSVIAKPFVSSELLNRPSGHIAGILIASVISILFSLFYVIFFLRFKTFWAGIIYGILLWWLFFYMIGPGLGMTKPITKLDANTISTGIALFMLYGLFVGYSLSAEFNGEEN